MTGDFLDTIRDAMSHGDQPWDTEAAIELVEQCARKHSTDERVEAARRYASSNRLGLQAASPARWVLAAIVFAGIASRFAPSGDELLDGQQGETSVLKAILVCGLTSDGLSGIEAASRSSLGANASFGMSVLRVLRNFLSAKRSSVEQLVELAREGIAVRELAGRINTPTPLRALYRGEVYFPMAEPTEVAAWFGFWARVCGQDRLGLKDELLASELAFARLLDRVREIREEVHVPWRPVRLYLQEKAPGLIALAQSGDDRSSYLEVGVELIGDDLFQLRVRWSFPDYGEHPVLDGFAQRLLVSLADSGAQFYS